MRPDQIVIINPGIPQNGLRSAKNTSYWFQANTILFKISMDIRGYCLNVLLNSRLELEFSKLILYQALRPILIESQIFLLLTLTQPTNLYIQSLIRSEL